jgi:uncharacterized protein YyaL (SSP411 family)
MRARLTHCLLALAALVAAAPRPAPAEESAPNRIPWTDWSDATFARAKAERRIVLVVVSTTWCHWCHVMQRETYADARVERALARAFVPIKADADARPDLSERFRKYRWPATGFLTPDGEPILALRGYRSAAEFLPVLADVEARVKRGGPYPGFDAPAPPATVVTEATRPELEALRARLVAQLDQSYDARFQGWGAGQKYPLAEPIEWGLRDARVRTGESQALRRALDTLAAQEALLDPVWGGMFQYSVGPAWNDPHYEKLIEVNAGALRAYADAYLLTQNARWRAAGANVVRWFEGFIVGPDGAFFGSQDAEVGGREATAFYRLDDAGRRKIGVPRVDLNVYARENGLVIAAFVAWGWADGRREPIAVARRAAERILSTHLEPSGLFRHAADSRGLLFLQDQAEMGRALIALGRVTLDPRWVDAALRTADAVVRSFAHPAGGFCDTAGDPTRQRSLEGNAAVARFLLDAAAARDRPDLRREAQRATLAVGDPAYVAEHWRYVGGLLLAVDQALTVPRKVTVFGDPTDERALALRAAALRERVRSEPDLAVVGAALKPAAGEVPFAVVCEPDGSCSEPETEPFGLADRLKGGRPR